MQIKKQENKFTIKASFDELIILHNAFNEICNRIHIQSFEHKIGISKLKTNIMLDVLGNALTNIEEQRQKEKNDFF